MSRNSAPDRDRSDNLRFLQCMPIGQSNLKSRSVGLNPDKVSSQFSRLIFLQKLSVKHHNNVDEYHSQLLIAALSVCVKVCVCVCDSGGRRHTQSHRVSEEAGGRGGVQLAPSNENPSLLKQTGGVPLPSAVSLHQHANTHPAHGPQGFSPALRLMTAPRSIFTLSVVGGEWVASLRWHLNGWKTPEDHVPLVWSSLVSQHESRREIRSHVYQRGGNQCRDSRSDALFVLF